VLRGRGYRTPQWTVTDEYKKMVEWWLAEEIQRYFREKPSQVLLRSPRAFAV
jgi:hypothetical protein